MSPPAAFLSEKHSSTLEAVCAALLTDAARTAAALAALLDVAGSATDQTRIRLALAALESRFLNGLLTGRFRRLTAMTPAEREHVLQAWATSRWSVLRAGFQAFKRVALFLSYCQVDPHTGINPHWPALGYPGPPPAVPPVAKTLRPLAVTADTTLDVDAVVIGSGAGGGVMAAELAAAGMQVLVLEKGGYFNETDFDGVEVKAVQNLYEKRGLLTTDDGGVVVFAGSCLGGGTTVNWTTSLRTPDFVLREWEQEHGIAGAAGPEWQASLDAVCRRIHVNADESEPNPQNQKLIDGCTALGHRWQRLPRNVKGCVDCGYCGFGCRFGAKQGVLKTYLQDAFEHGATLIAGCHVDRVVIRNGVAVGVEATVGGRRLTVRSRLVVAAAGSIHTPALLKRSGLANKNIGRHLHLHPTVSVFGIYDQPIESWHGTMQAMVCDQFADQDGGYGCVVEVPPAHPGMLALALPWRDAASHRHLMCQAAKLASFVVITRDRDGGEVRLDRRGQPVLHYTTSAADARHLIRGAQEAVRLHVAAGAHTIGGPYNNLPNLSPRNDGNVESYLRPFTALGVRANDMTLFSAHQMSSCRMGHARQRAAVTPDGETYEVRNLYVADASALPTATGVNPMVSILALAHRNAQIIKSRT